MLQNKSMVVFQTGGTIDKRYPRRVSGYSSEMDPSSAITKITGLPVEFVTICEKGSQTITDRDRGQILLNIRRVVQSRILISHSADTLIQTAQYLGPRIDNKVVALSGAHLPVTFKDSDADSNIGLALRALQQSEVPGVYIAINDRLFLWSEVKRDNILGHSSGKI